MPVSRLVAPAAALSLIALLALSLPATDALGRPLPLSLLLGAAFGLVLQRTRFCFWCNARDWFERREPSGLLAIVVALATGAVGYAVVLGAWVPDPFAGRLPPDAHIGPVSLTLAAGAFAFGLGKAISGSCISAHLYRLGEGSFGSLVALLGAFLGFVFGFLSWKTLWLRDVISAPVVWLPGYLGHAGSLALTLGLLGGLVALLIWRGSFDAPVPRSGFAALVKTRWPGVPGGILIGFIATLAYFRVGPLGVTAEIGSLSRTAAAALGILPDTLPGLDSLRGCATVIKETLASRNGVFVAGLVLAAFASAHAAGDWKPALPAPRDLPRLFFGGVLLGWGAMVALGCTVGVILSGIMAGAGSGWVFALACGLGGWTGWRLRGGKRIS